MTDVLLLEFLINALYGDKIYFNHVIKNKKLPTHFLKQL